MNKRAVVGYIVFLAFLTIATKIPLSNCTSDEVYLSIDAPALSYRDLKPGYRFNVGVKVNNISYVNKFGIEKVRVTFNFEIIDHQVRILYGNIDSTLSETQYYGWYGKQEPIGETVNFEVTMRDDVEYPSNHWYEVYFNFKISELEPGQRAYIIGETLDEKTIKYIVYGEDYIDFVYTLISGLDPTQIDYTYQLGLSIDEILGSGTRIDLMGFSDEDGYGYAWAKVKPNIDGVMGPNEWQDAYHYSESSTDLYVKNDEENLYLLYSVEDSLDPNDAVLIKFDNNADGSASEWEDALKVICSDGLLYDMHWHREVYFDTDMGGSCDGVAAYSHKDGITFFEISHPLKSFDIYDFNLSQLDLFGLGITYYDDGAISFNQPELYSEHNSGQMWRIRVACEPLEPDKNKTIIELNTKPEYPVMNKDTLVTGVLTPSNSGETVVLNFRINLITIDSITTETGFDGSFTTKYSFKESGIWNIKAEFLGDEELYPCETVQTIQVYPITTKQDTEQNTEQDTEQDTKQNTTIILNAATNQENELQIDGILLPYPQDERVLVLINGSSHTVNTDENGYFNLIYDVQKSGKYNITAYYLGNSVYSSSKATLWILVDVLPEDQMPSENNDRIEVKLLNIIMSLDETEVVTIGSIAVAAGYLLRRRL